MPVSRIQTELRASPFLALLEDSHSQTTLQHGICFRLVNIVNGLESANLCHVRGAQGARLEDLVCELLVCSTAARGIYCCSK